jgi:AcrR family transcriptional regulator
MRVTAETKHATRDRILDVAKKLFAQQGFDATTTRDIARAAEIAVGTLFNYFPTKESIVARLVNDACAGAAEEYKRRNGEPAPSALSIDAGSIDAGSIDAGADCGDDAPTLEEELFAHAAVILRKLKPYRKYLLAALETTLSPLADHRGNEDHESSRTSHLEMVTKIAAAHGQHENLSAVALHLYWTLYTGVLAFWATDRSPRQEETLGLLDQSLAMFVGWLAIQPNPHSVQSK